MRKYDSKSFQYCAPTTYLADRKAAKSRRKKQCGCKILAHFGTRYSLLDYRPYR
jgi:hypothetical protein